jgi:hypothetical protein
MIADNLPAYAHDIAPHIDRLAIALHRHARHVAPPVLQAFGLTSAGVLIDARPLLLAGPISVDNLAIIERDIPRESLAPALDRHV